MHHWMYKGENPYYATCPHCYNKVPILRGDAPGVCHHGTRNKKGGLIENG